MEKLIAATDEEWRTVKVSLGRNKEILDAEMWGNLQSH